MLRFFRHGDRRLALFNNSSEEDGVLVDLVLTRSEAKGLAPAQAFLVQGAGNQFLARTRLALDKDGLVRTRHFLDLLYHFPDTVALSQDAG